MSNRYGPVPTEDSGYGYGYRGEDSEDPSSSSSLKGRFPSGGWRDWPWLLLFVLHLIAFITIGVYYAAQHWGEMNTPNPSASDTTKTDISLSSNKTWATILLLLSLSVLLSLAWLVVCKSFPRQTIWFTLISSVVLQIAIFVLFLVIQSFVAACIMGVVTLFLCLWIYYIQYRIPFSACILETCLKSIHAFPNTGFVVMAGVITQITWIIGFVICFLGIFYALNNKTIRVSSGTSIVVYFCCVLSFFWTSQVIKNIVHVTVAGVTGTWYFLHPSYIYLSQSPVWQSFRRATTWSLGSICLGSLILALVQAIKSTLYAIRSNLDRDSCAAAVCLWLIECFLQCVEDWLEFINEYAFTYVAVYGKAYWEAGKQTWELFASRGLDMLVNFSLIGTVIGIGSFLGGLLVCAIAGFIAWALLDSNSVALWCLIGFLIGFAIMISVLEVVRSASTAFFVCFAEDPHTLHVNHPNEYQEIQQYVDSREYRQFVANQPPRGVR